MTTTLNGLSGRRPAPDVASRSWPRELVVPLGLAMTMLQLGHRAWALATGWFYTDDYALLMSAQARGLTRDYLLEPYNSHLMPGTRFLAWVVEASGPLNWGLALTITLFLQAAASLACLWMLVTVFGRRWLVLAPFGIYLTSAISAQASLWWISSLNQISIQVTFFVAVGAWVRYLRTRRLRWLGAAGLAVAVGLLFFQKSLLVLPVLIFLALVYFASGSPLRRLLFLLRRYWPAVVLMGAVAGGYTVYSLREVSQPFTAGGDRLDVVRLAWHMGNAAVVGALGGPWRWQWHPGGSWAHTPVAVTAVAQLVVLAVAAYAVATRRRAGWAWVLLLGYLAVLVALVATSRTPVFGASIGLAYRFQTDLLCVLVLCLGLAFAPVEGARQSSEPRERVRGSGDLARLLSMAPPPTWVAGAVALVCLSGLACWTAYAVSWHRHTNASRDYLHTLDHDLRRAGTTAIADDPVPGSVLPGAFFTEDQRRLSRMVDLLGRDAEYPRSSAELAMVSRTGELHRAMVDPSATNREGPHENCGWLGTAPRLRVPLTARTIDLDWWVRIGYLSTADDDVTVTAGDRSVRARVSQGLGSIYVRTTGAFSSVVVSDLSPGTRLCVDPVEVGTLVEGPRL